MPDHSAQSSSTKLDKLAHTPTTTFSKKDLRCANRNIFVTIAHEISTFCNRNTAKTQIFAPKPHFIALKKQILPPLFVKIF